MITVSFGANSFRIALDDVILACSPGPAGGCCWQTSSLRLYLFGFPLVQIRMIEHLINARAHFLSSGGDVKVKWSFFLVPQPG